MTADPVPDLDRASLPAAVRPGARVGLSWPPASGAAGRVLSVSGDRLMARVRLEDGSELELEPGDFYLLRDPRR